MMRNGRVRRLRSLQSDSFEFKFVIVFNVTVMLYEMKRYIYYKKSAALRDA